MGILSTSTVHSAGAGPSQDHDSGGGGDAHNISFRELIQCHILVLQTRVTNFEGGALAPKAPPPPALCVTEIQKKGCRQHAPRQAQQNYCGVTSKSIRL